MLLNSPAPLRYTPDTMPATPAPEPWIEERADGVYLKVRAAPGASREGLRGVHGDAIKIAVTAPPEDGRANAALCELLARLLGLRAQEVELVSGASGRDKRFRLGSGASPGCEALAARLRAALKMV